MSHRLQRTPGRPPPLFVAELDAAPAHGSVAAPSRTKDEPDRRMARTAEVGDRVQANPWPYHGPGFGDDENGPSATVLPTVQHQGPGGLSANGLDGDGDEDGDGDGDGDGEMASLRLDAVAGAAAAARDTKTTTTPAPIKPYCPPPERHDVLSAGGLRSPPTSAGPKSVAQVAYRPYRPPSVPSPAGNPGTRPGTQSPSSLGAAPHHHHHHHHSYRPFDADSQPGSPAPDEATGQQEHAASPALVPVSEPAPNTTTTSSSCPPPSSSSTQHAHVPTTMAQASAGGTTTLSPTPIRPTHPPQMEASPWPPWPSPASSDTAHPPTWTPSPHSPPQPNYPGPQAQYANSSAAYYPFPNESRPDSQPETNPAGHQHQCPPYSRPPLASPHPTQPVYATNNTPPNPPFSPGKPPPPLPPRRPQAQHHGGFGGGPVDAAAYPRPPKTHHNPMPPAHPPRPGPSSLTSGSLFSASSAKKWFDKTSQVLESKLEAVLQGPSGPAYRPAYATNAPPRHHPGGSQRRGVPPPPQGSYGCAPGPGPWGQGPPPGWRGP
ncbi:hypothetical protein C2857_003575 [Epichloe festucae Fl1]|uniref:Uncharacterized protein n=1 Tax=Epichloe festucae (strain Fl1) TaxID=877507 RepID=A0A7U3SNL9_EPIFF|nr:hypothetical protein C2857_003575 [Epichloe festucae Fl1]